MLCSGLRIAAFSDVCARSGLAGGSHPPAQVDLRVLRAPYRSSSCRFAFCTRKLLAGYSLRNFLAGQAAVTPRVKAVQGRTHANQ